MNTIYAIMDALLPFELFQCTFMKNALLAMLLLTPLLALLGTMAVNKRMAFFSDALGHSALTGLGIGVLLGMSNVTVILVCFGILWAMLQPPLRLQGGYDGFGILHFKAADALQQLLKGHGFRL